MNYRIRRYSAFLALFLLSLAFFGVIWHDIAQLHGEKASSAEPACALCYFSDTFTRVILPAAIAIFVAICRKITANRAQSVAIRVTARSFPMLC